jgi:hypothetical protein
MMRDHAGIRIAQRPPIGGARMRCWAINKDVWGRARDDHGPNAGIPNDEQGRGQRPLAAVRAMQGGHFD